MGRLYERLEAYDEALKRYWFLIRYFNRGDYYKDVANIWKKRGDEEKYGTSMKAYNKVMKKNTSNNGIEIQEVKVWTDWVIELK